MVCTNKVSVTIETLICSYGSLILLSRYLYPYIISLTQREMELLQMRETSPKKIFHILIPFTTSPSPSCHLRSPRTFIIC